MLRKATLGFIVSFLAFSSNLVFADNDPSMHQVYEATQAGKFGDAQAMMDKVLKDHPDSAKAHYVEAEILAKQGEMSRADAELNTAERLAPGLPFAKPQSVQELKGVISGSARHINQQVENGNPPASSSSFPWGMILLGIAAIAAIIYFIRAMNARNQVYAPAQPFNQGPYGAAGQPYGPVGMGPAAGGGMGSGIMGGLATGAAVGVGMVAGEALAHHFMDGSSPGINTASAATDSWNQPQNDLGGSDFGIADNASWDDGSNIADSGGGDSWS